ncbi:BsuPI-related putative proteinase inhibitor [Cohnella terricola]|uniref:Intracellular proteinase inhibitor BsuPI domain-containing protein n=1 Tax=Cohnella terricola TaxID=1289167 RepID=A0A559JMT4_9BACL|nr:BsuPI-related putative proteinase inhibitor [Cohnella terricola]TVY01191.1 hypothetical protein FPZ45_08560 [Cohnella terricola]
MEMGKRRYRTVLGAALLLLAGCSAAASDKERSAGNPASFSAQPADSGQTRTVEPRTFKDTDVQIGKKTIKLTKDLLKTTLATETDSEEVKLRFSLANVSGRDLKISHASGYRYDFVVYNGSDQENYTWSNGKAFTEALIMRVLQNNESLDFSETWNLTDNDGNPVPNGEYRIVLTIIAKVELADGEQADPEQFSAEAIVRIER